MSLIWLVLGLFILLSAVIGISLGIYFYVKKKPTEPTPSSR